MLSLSCAVSCVEKMHSLHEAENHRHPQMYTHPFEVPLPAGGSWRPQGNSPYLPCIPAESPGVGDSLGHLCSVGVISLHSPQDWLCFVSGAAPIPPVPSSVPVPCWGHSSGQRRPGPASQPHCPEGGWERQVANPPLQTERRVWKEVNQRLG